MMTSVEKSYTYDIFISFRGKDLRTSFVDHLCAAFRKKGIIVFKDDKHIEVGQRISDELPKAIQDSKFHIVIFSQRYADSYWCLNELIEILECQNPEGELTFFPIFYHVKPSEVRDVKGSVGEAFSVHSANETAGRWRAAMEKAATLEGWELTKTGDGHEVQFIEKIVHAISQKPYFANYNVNKNLVGMTTRVEKLLLSLQVGSDDVRMIGITGLGGIGKTTLASVVFNRIANQFDGKSFVENVRECSEDSRGLQEMQKQILTSVFGEKRIDVPSDVEGRSMMKRRMPRIKVLVVLDDVNDVKQLEALAEPSWFRPGSRIIITSRDRQVLVAHGVESHNIHVVSTLSDEDAIRLLSVYAFNTESPAQGYDELSEKVLRYAAGLPLTIKTLSSSLRGFPTYAWEDAITRLETIPWGDTLKILKISYDALEEDQKEIFLHVACLLKGHGKKRAIRILESLGFRAKFGLGVLEQKSLITLRDGRDYDYFDYEDKKLLDMHDHVEEMGMHIVRSLHPDEPQQHKLLWISDEIEDIIEKDMGTEAIRGIKLLHTFLDPAKILGSLRKMSKLCFLHVGLGPVLVYSHDTLYEFDEAGLYLPNSLQFLYWRRYPFRYLPNTYKGEKLVEMEMPWSYTHQLWEGGEKKVLPKLRLLNLCNSRLETFDSAGMTPNLEELVLRRCEKLVEVNICDECSHVKKLYLSDCRVLKKLTISNTCRNLDKLDLRGCISLRELQFHGECPSLEFLNLSNTKLRRFNLGLTPNLGVLRLEYCEDLVELVMPGEHPMLRDLSLSGATKLLSLNLGLFPNLEVLSVKDCEDLNMPVECQNLTSVSLSGINKLGRLNLGLTPNLEVFQLEYCENLQEIVMPVECPILRELSLIGMNKLRSFNLGLAPNLEALSVEYCENLEELVMPVEYPMLRKLSLSGINKLRSFNLGLAPNLEQLRLERCENLEEIYVPVERPARLRVFSVFSYKDTSSDEPWPFSNLEKLKSLEELRFWSKDMNHPPDSILMFKHLRKLNFEWWLNLKWLPEDLDRLECLEVLSLLGCESLRNIPNCICNMTRLKVLDLSYCYQLEKLPDEFRRLQSLQVFESSRKHFPMGRSCGN